jgi:hypothetical protein
MAVAAEECDIKVISFNTFAFAVNRPIAMRRHYRPVICRAVLTRLAFGCV